MTHMIRITFADGSFGYFTIDESRMVAAVMGPVVAAVTRAHRPSDFDEQIELPNLGRVVNRYGVVVS